MKRLKNTGFSILFLLIFVCGLIATGYNSVRFNAPVAGPTTETIQSSEIQNEDQPVYLEIEGHFFVPGITASHKLVSIVILPNRMIPVNFDFRLINYIPVLVNFCSPVSIFIKGHALLN